MPDASTFAAFAVASLALLVIPGPAVLYIVNRSVSDGRTVGLAAVAGIELGNLVHALAAAAGLSAVLATSATAFNAVKWLGAGYLIVVGVRTLVRPPAADHQRPGGDQPPPSVRARLRRQHPQPQGRAVLPVVPAAVHPHRPAAAPAAQALALGIVFVLIGCLTRQPVLVARRAACRGVLVRGRGLPFVQRYVAGTVFIGLGVVAATASAGHQRRRAAR